jgi:xanthine dehydrogenase iron-sulfur cluster and FAD-binding subunit A
LVRDARQALESEVAPIDDIRSSAAYRTHVAGNLLQEFVESLFAREQASVEHAQ